MVKVFRSVSLSDGQRSYQKRHNYEYKGVEIALKFSETWGYHAELEIVITDKARQVEVEAKIRDVAEELDIRLMTNEEIKEFCEAIDQQNLTK